MEMPGPADIQSRFDGAEFVEPTRPREKLAEAREVAIGGGISCCAPRIDVVAAIVSVPQFHQRPFDGIAAGIEDAACNIGDEAGGGSKIVVQINQVVVF